MTTFARQALIWTTAAMLALPIFVQAQDFTYTSNVEHTITITKYTGGGAAVSIPDTIKGLTVTRIGGWAFYHRTRLASVTISDSVDSIGTTAFNACTNLASVTIGSGVTNIENWAFVNCSQLTSICFKGNSPRLGRKVFEGDDKATIYYLPDTTGWSNSFGGRPTAIWRPQGRQGNGTTHTPLVPLAQAYLDGLNGWNKAAIDVVERPTAHPNMKDSGETRGFVNDAKRRLAELGVKVKWNADTLTYEVVK